MHKATGMLWGGIGINTAVAPVQPVNAQVSRTDQRIALWWPEPHTDIKYWLPDITVDSHWGVTMASLLFIKACLTRKSVETLRFVNAVTVACDFDVEVVTTDNMHLVDGHLPYEVRVASYLRLYGVDQLATYKCAIQKVQEVVDWLETDPVIDGLHISQHAWNQQAHIFRNEQLCETRAAEARMKDPAFTKTEAHNIVRQLRTSAIAKAGTPDNSCHTSSLLNLCGRDGSYKEKEVCIIQAHRSRVDSNTYRAEYGWYNHRVTFRVDHSDKSKKEVVALLQEAISASKNASWREDIT